MITSDSSDSSDINYANIESLFRSLVQGGPSNSAIKGKQEESLRTNRHERSDKKGEQLLSTDLSMGFKNSVIPVTTVTKDQ